MLESKLKFKEVQDRRENPNLISSYMVSEDLGMERNRDFVVGEALWPCAKLEVTDPD